MTRHFNPQPATAGRLRRGCARWWMACRASFLIGTVNLIFAISMVSLRAQEPAPTEYQVKAAFLINFPKYVDWPTNAFAKTNSPIIIAVFGDENVADEVQTMIGNGRAVSGHPLVLERITREKQINRDCQVLFIGASEQDRMPSILEQIRGGSTLTVSENNDFPDNDGVINLIRKNRRIRLQVNLIAARDERLKISSRLLIAADEVKGKSN